MYDYLIVGAGLSGAIFAHEATKRGKKVKVIDKRDHIGGNIYCEDVEVSTFTSMVLTFSIPQIKKFGIMSTNLLSLITISTHQLLTTRAVFTTFHLT